MIPDVSTLPEGQRFSMTRRFRASLADLSARMGHDLSIHRWRGNLWLDGAPAWEEWNWIGRRLQIGVAVAEGAGLRRAARSVVLRVKKQHQRLAVELVAAALHPLGIAQGDQGGTVADGWGWGHAGGVELRQG